MTELSAEQQVVRLENRLRREREARKQAEKLLTEKSVALFEALQESQKVQSKLELAMWATQESFWEWEAESDIVSMRSFGLKQNDINEWRGSPFKLLSQIHEDDIATFEYQWAMAVHGGQDKLEVSFRFRVADTYQWMRMRGRVLDREQSGGALYIVGTNRDITRERKAEQSFHLMASAFSSSREPMLVLSVDLVITECNSAFLKIMQLNNKKECIGESLATLLPQDGEILQTIKRQQQVRFESVLVTGKGDEIAVDVSLALFETQYQTSSYVIATMRDISEKKISEERLRKLALHDDLTGLKNRNGLRDAINEAASSKDEFILVFIDLDGFKKINDTAGHDEGDLALRSVANILCRKFKEQQYIARWGGDEFVVISTMLGLTDGEALCTEVIKEIESLRIAKADTDLKLSASIGLAHFPTHGNSVDNLIQNADAAMYQAKTSGKGHVYIYQHGLLESMQEQVSMVSDLTRAVNNQSLDFYIQGKYDLYGHLKGGEVLCRWRSPLHGQVSPGVFIPLAETYQLDHKIGLQALDAACDYVTILETNGIVAPMAINISASQILDKHFADQALEICQSNGVSPEMIEIELTESIFIRDQKSALRALNRLRDIGFKLALDDFGSGFSSLSYLRSFNFEVVKLDRSLVRDINHDSKALSLMQGIVAMLSGLQLKIVAEGVEHEEYVPFLREAGVHLLQGFHFDKPMPYDIFLSKHCGFD